MEKMKRYKITAKNVEYIMTQYIKAHNKQEAKERFISYWKEGDFAVNNNEIQFQEIKITEGGKL